VRVVAVTRRTRIWLGCIGAVLLVVVVGVILDNVGVLPRWLVGWPATTVWVVGVDGRGAHEVATDNSPSFTPDGRLVGGGGPPEFVGIRRGTQPQIGVGGYGDEPAISPNGREIAYGVCSFVCNGGYDGIGVIAVSGGTSRTLTQWGDNPAWSPNGQWIVFSAPGSSNCCPVAYGPLPVPSLGNGVWMIRADGTDLHRLINFGGLPADTKPSNSNPSTANPTFDPSGQRIAFSMNGDIYTINTSGDQLRRLTSTGHNMQPTWAPNGTRIAFIHACQGIWLVTPNGSDVTPIPNTAGATDPAWAPDSARLAYEINGHPTCSK
jgi:hypothetical protein